MSFKKSSFNFEANAEMVEKDEFKVIEPFDGAGFSVPQDVILAAGVGSRKPPPLSLLTPFAINLDQRGRSVSLVTTGSSSSSLKVNNELHATLSVWDKKLESGDWWSAKSLSLIALESLFDEKAAKHFQEMFWAHMQEILYRVNSRSWLALKEYDQMVTRNFYKDLEATDNWRKLEEEKAKKVGANQGGAAGGVVKAPAPPKFDAWNQQLFETACRKFGTTSAEVLDLNHIPPSEHSSQLVELLNIQSTSSVAQVIDFREKLERSILSALTPSLSTPTSSTLSPLPRPQAPFAFDAASVPVGSRSMSPLSGGSFDVASNSCGICGELGGHSWAFCRSYNPQIVEIRGNGFGLINAPGPHVCNLFNSIKGCSSQSCRFLHGCTRCGSTDGSHGNYLCHHRSIPPSTLSQPQTSVPPQMQAQILQQPQASTSSQVQPSFESSNSSEW